MSGSGTGIAQDSTLQAILTAVGGSGGGSGNGLAQDSTAKAILTALGGSGGGSGTGFVQDSTLKAILTAFGGSGGSGKGVGQDATAKLILTALGGSGGGSGTGPVQDATLQAIAPLVGRFSGTRVGPFAAGVNFKRAAGAGGPQMGNGTTLVMLYYLTSLPAGDKQPASYVDPAVLLSGWELNWDLNNALAMGYRGGGGGSMGLGSDTSTGLHCVACTDTGGNMRFSRDGAAVLFGASVAYVTTSAGSIFYLGTSTDGGSDFPFTNGGLLAMVMLNRAATDTELRAWSSMGWDNLFALPASLTGDANKTFDLLGKRDYATAGQGTVVTPATPQLGAMTFATQGGGPAITAMAEQIYLAQVSKYLDTLTPVANGDVYRTSCYARYRFTTSDTIMWVEMERDISTTYNAYATIDVFSNGVHQSQVFALQDTGLQRSSQQIALPAGAGKTIDFIMGSQVTLNNGANILGTYLRSVRGSFGGVTYPTTATPTRQVAGYGDSIMAGGDVTTAANAYMMLLRANMLSTTMGGVSMTAWGGRALFDDVTNTLAAQLVSLAQNSSGTKHIVIAIGTNDYGLNRQSAANFGTQYAALLDAIIALDSTITIWCITPFPRIAPASEANNVFGVGNSLPDYRAQIETAVSTRTAYCNLVRGTTSFGFVQSTTVDWDTDGIHLRNAGHVKVYQKLADLIYGGFVTTNLVLDINAANADVSANVVQTIADASGTTVDAGKNSVKAGSPAYTAAAAGYNNKPTFTAAAADWVVTGTWAAAISQPMTVYFVGQSACVAAFEGLFSNDGAGAAEIGFWATNGPGNELDIDGVATVQAGFLPQSPGVNCVVVDHAAGPSWYINDHTTPIRTGAAGAAVDTMQKLIMGSDHANADPGNGKKARYLVYSGAHNASQRLAVMNYLGTTYGITVT